MSEPNNHTVVEDRDGDLWGASLPRKGPDQYPPGRGYLVVEGEVELTQAAHR